MRPIVTNRVAWSVGLYVTVLSPAKKGSTDQDAVWVEDSGWPNVPCIRWVPDPPWEGVILKGEGAAHCKV